jgi:hypothetical protein
LNITNKVVFGLPLLGKDNCVILAKVSLHKEHSDIFGVDIQQAIVELVILKRDILEGGVPFKQDTIGSDEILFLWFNIARVNNEKGLVGRGNVRLDIGDIYFFLDYGWQSIEYGHLGLVL